MKNNIIKMKQDLSWHCIHVALEDINGYWNICDEKFQKLFNELFDYVESKINPPIDSGEVVGIYVVTEYKEVED